MANQFSLRLDKVVPGAIDEVFDAWLDPAALSAWMNLTPGGTVEATIDPVVGGRYRILMKSPEGDNPHNGEYRIIDRPSKLVFTWNSPWATDTLVTLEFERLSAQETRVSLLHERFPDEKGVEMHRGGWTAILDKAVEFIQARHSRR